MHMMKEAHKSDTGNKEYDSLKATTASLVGGNSDGRNLFLVVEVFDGEHNNRFEPVFPVDTSAKEVTAYLKSIVEKNPKLSAELNNIMGQKVFWDQKKDGWFSQMGTEEPVSIGKSDKDK